MRATVLIIIYMFSSLFSYTQSESIIAKAYRNQIDFINEKPLFETKFE